MTALTPLMARVLDIITAHSRAHGCVPSLREIAKAIGGHGSPSTAHRLVDALVARGYLKRLPQLHGKRGARGYTLVFGAEAEPNWESVARLLITENAAMRQTLAANRLAAPTKAVDY